MCAGRAVADPTRFKWGMERRGQITINEIANVDVTQIWDTTSLQFILSLVTCTHTSAVLEGSLAFFLRFIANDAAAHSKINTNNREL
jgi:hypothetical protein